MRLTQTYLAMIIAQTPQVGDADFRDVLSMLINGGEL